MDRLSVGEDVEQLLGVHKGTTSLESCVALYTKGDDTCYTLT